jgi:NADPH-dependent ferric siderophore reductase
MSAVQPHAAPAHPAVDRVVTRVRHEVKMRRLEVRRSERLSPSMVRLVLVGDDLAGFTSAGFDDHVKIFLPAPGAREPLLPTMGPKGLTFLEGAERPAARDFTPRKYDAEAGELTIDFVLHDAGPATAWAANAQQGDYLGVGGPRGSMIVPKDFRMHILIGDETAIPAIARRLEELPGGVRARVFAEVEAPGHELNLESAADLELTWVHRSGAPAGEALLAAVRSANLTGGGDLYAWVACESSVAKLMRSHLVDERQFNPKRIKAAGYWKRGAVAVHEMHEG